MVNFTGGIIKYGSRYIPTSSISFITGNQYPDGKCSITLINQVSPSKVILADVSAEKFANAYIKAEQEGKIVDVMA